MNRPEATSPRSKHLIAFASPRGGAGRSTLIVELARALARREQRVLVVDLNPQNFTLSTLLDCAERPPIYTLAAIQERAPHAASHPTSDPNTKLLPLRFPAAPLPRHSADLMQWLRRANADWVLLDLPCGFEPHLISLLLGSDLPVLVTTPDPAALVACGAFLRACLLHTLRQHPDLTPQAVEALQDPIFETLWRWPQLVERLPEGRDRDELLSQTCTHITLGLLINQTRETSEADQALALSHAWGLEIGVWPRPLGTVQFDERRWFFTRRLAPPALHVRDDSMMGDIDLIARNILGLDWLQWAQPRACLPNIAPHLFSRPFLDLPETATPNEAQQRYRRLWEAYRREPGFVSFITDPPTRQVTLDLLDQAYRSIKVATNPSIEIPVLPESVRAQHPGQVLRAARLRTGLGMRELSLRTRVSVKHIEAIEAGNRRDLPARVYLKAYLTEIARTLGLEPDIIVEDYIDRLDNRSL